MRLFRVAFTVIIIFLVTGCGYVYYNTSQKNMLNVFSKIAVKESPKTVYVEVDRKKTAETKQRQSIGSGVIISKDGYIITNCHVIEGAAKITIITYNMNEYEAVVIGKDPKIDIALLKIESSKPFPAVRIGDSDKIKIGEWVVSIGNPFGYTSSITAGIVSGKERSIKTTLHNVFIQVDLVLNPGSSGGPLFNLSGELIGINTIAMCRDAECIINANVGLTIPINIIMFSIKQLKKGNEVVRGDFGVTVQFIDSRLKAKHSLKSRKGAFVCNIIKNSSADRAGLKIKDVIISFDGKEVKDVHKLLHILSMTPVGKKTKVVVLRNDKKIMLTAILRNPDQDKIFLIPESHSE
jgi:serine protease Do